MLSGVEPAFSAGFSVNPIHLELNPSRNATSVTVTNFNSDVLVMQVRVYRWEHDGNQDVLTDAGSEGPLVTPPLFRLAPTGGSQVIRIGFQDNTPQTQERQWRVIVEEVPKAKAVAATGADGDSAPLSIAVHVRVSLPLFQRPTISHQDLQWTLERTASSSVKLNAQNLGSITERVDGLHLGPTDDASASVPGPIYVFPGERRTFELHPHDLLPAGHVRLSVQGTPRPLIRELVLSAQ